MSDDVAASFSTRVLGLANVVATRDGGFTVVWGELAGGSSRGRFARDYSATGSSIGGRRTVSSSLTGGQTE